ncbi:MAG: tRNA pseudouridine(55) synthase TruB [Acidobacteria bacterium]|nr:tRNA pseudouridine(55) synthase TruB [Acidobacteriota bacterium]
MDGILVVDKPAGPTSHDVVDRVRRATGVRRIGHTGTLDPFATGVLPLVVGRATRLAQFLSATDKSYDAAIRLGCATDTYDVTGRVIEGGGAASLGGMAAAPALPGREAIAAALATFAGCYEQTPPPFSAKKVGGVRSYVRARHGEPVQPKAVQVTVRDLELVAVDGDLVSVRLTCSPGFYVRALAHALGERLTVGAHLQALRRTRSGGFDADHAAPLDVIEREGPLALQRLVPLAEALPHLPAAVLTRAGIDRAVHGAVLAAADFLEAPPTGHAGPVRLLDADGALVAMARPGPAPGTLHPFVVVG